MLQDEIREILVPLNLATLNLALNIWLFQNLFREIQIFFINCLSGNGICYVILMKACTFGIEYVLNGELYLAEGNAFKRIRLVIFIYLLVHLKPVSFILYVSHKTDSYQFSFST